MAYTHEYAASADEREQVEAKAARRAARATTSKRHTALHGLTVAAIGFVLFGAAYCLVSGARTVAAATQPAAASEVAR